MKRFIFILALFVFWTVQSYAQTATINWTNVHQVIDGFGAAEPLSPNANLTTSAQNFFFGTGAGQLGLSILRVAATANGGYGPGDCSTVSTSCAGPYVADMQSVVSHGGRVYASPWSPPAAFKTNANLTCTGGSGSGALASASYANFATWITNFSKSLSSLESVNLYAVSLQNEPNNCPTYDGALYNASQVDTFIKTNLGPTFAANSISTLIFAPETENYSGLSGIGGTCFTDASCYNFTGGINWHDYDSNAATNSTGSTSSTPNPWASLGKKYWETEAACGNGYGPSACESGTSFSTDMITDGLMWASLIDNRIAIQNANAYLYFALIGTTSSNLGLTSGPTAPASGTVAKRAYVFGQYSAFVRPGYFRIDATHAPQSGVAVSAYQNVSSGNLVVMATNYNGSPVAQNFSITNAPSFSTVTPYITSTSLSLAAQSNVAVSSNSFSYTLPAQSVTTFTGTSSSSTSWTGILSSQRAIDWSQNGATITNRSVQCGGTITAYSGTAATINTALSSCTPGDYVQLGAGTFTLSSSIITTASNVTLRGMGPTQTFIVFTATSTNCNGVNATSVCIWNGDSSSFQFSGAHNATVSGSFAQGSASLTFANVTGLGDGNNVIFTQSDDSSDPGNIYVCQQSGVTGDCSQQGGGGVAKTGQAQTQNVTVTNISGSVVTFTPGLYAPNWTSGKSPNAWWSNNLPITGFGIENLDLDYSNMGSKENGIEFHNANNCWVKNIRSVNSVASGGATHKHINIYASNHVTVRDSYFYGASPTSEGYGVDNGPGSANNLVENNIFQHLPTGMINETSCCDVFGYNYSVDNYYNNGAPNWQQQGEFHHGAGDNYILWEGNQSVSGFDADDIHGTSFFLTHFRDYLAGHDPTSTLPTAPKNQATFAYFPFANARYNAIIASVLGTQSYHTFYQNTPLNTTDCSGSSGNSALSVFVFGFGDQAGTCYVTPTQAFTIYNDSLVASSQIRWGNYAACTGDAACNAVRFQTSEDASGAPVYPGLNPPSSTFPASFYLASKPSWWGSMPWPPVGPDVTGGNVANVGGHVYLSPSANCYLNIMGGSTNGSTGILSFDANTCYNGPATPTNVQVSIQILNP